MLLLFNISRPQRLIELSNVTQIVSRTLAENSQSSEVATQLDNNVAETMPDFKRGSKESSLMSRCP